MRICSSEPFAHPVHASATLSTSKDHSCEELLPTDLHSPSPYLPIVNEDSILSTSVDMFLNNFLEDSEQDDFEINETDNVNLTNFYQNLPSVSHKMYPPFYDVSPEKQCDSDLENLEKENQTNASDSLSSSLIRGRSKKRELNKRVRILESRQRKSFKHLIREPCEISCRMHCQQKVTLERRKEIWEAFWSGTNDQKNAYILRSVKKKQKARQRSKSNKSKTKKRNYSHEYLLQDELGNDQNVCRTFFLTTLGFHKKNDWAITYAFQNSIDPNFLSENYSNKKVKTIIDYSKIKKHIESFHPSISHYRREHAPNRRYLPTDVTIRSMYDDYKSKFEENACSYESYRQTVKQMNISFVQLGGEQCEKCLQNSLHVKETHQQSSSSSELPFDCIKCNHWIEHKNRSQLARESYKTDATKIWPSHFSVKSVDLQKVMMLPRMPLIKSAAFTRRIVVFHETFASIGSKKDTKSDNISVTWHEGVGGRSAAEIASAFHTAIANERDKTHFVFWLDNCSAQNKNWTLFTSLITVVNEVDKRHKVEEVILKYFEPGHTFMSADSVHAGVERELKKQPEGNVLDFEDFMEVVRKSNNKKMKVVELQNEDIKAWKPQTSPLKLKSPSRPVLKLIAAVKFTRGTQDILFKLSYSEKSFQRFNYLKQKCDLSLPSCLRSSARGVCISKKEAIIQTLCPLMPENRRVFWNNLPESNVTNDLIADMS